MFNKHTAFTIVTVIVIVAAAIFANLRAPQNAREKALFFPELQEKLDQVAHIHIKSFDNTINLSRENDTWVVDEFDGYPALPDKVKATVLGVADLKLNAPKTALERLYPRLGVEGPVTDESQSKLLKMTDEQGNEIINVIIGIPRRSSTAQSSPGLYVRKPDETQSYLVDGQLDISAKKTDWIERSLLDIPAEEIKSVRIEHTDGDSYTLYKSEKGQDKFQLESLPEDKKLAPEIIINRFGAILADVQISSVRNQSSIPVDNEVIQARISTFDGLLVDMKALSIDGRPYANFKFGIDTINTSEDDDGIDKEELQKYADNMNKKLGSWLFEIQGFKYDIVKKRAEDIVRDSDQNFSTAE